MRNGAIGTEKDPVATSSAIVPEKIGLERSALALTTSETVAEEAPSPSAMSVAESVALV